jgi:hypothetical protein
VRSPFLSDLTFWTKLALVLDFHNAYETDNHHWNRIGDRGSGLGDQALIALPLWVIVVLLFGWGLQPKAMEELVGRLPYVGSYILKAFAILDSTLSRWS